MYIKKIELKNFQVISDFAADFEGNVYLVKGENELGKSTLLKAIAIMLTGNRDEVLRIGEDKGFAKMIVGDDGKQYEIELKFTKANPRGTLTIKDNNGLKSDNVTMLQKLLKYTDIDVVAFSRMSETADGRRKQVQIVKSLMQEDVRKRIDEIDAEVANIKEERKTVNATVKILTNTANDAAKNIEEGDIEKYTSEVNITGLLEEQKKQAEEDAKANAAREGINLRTKQLAEIDNRKQQAQHNKEQRLKDVEIRKKNAEEAYKAALESCNAEIESINAAYTNEIKKITDEAKEYAERKANAEKYLAEYESKPNNNIAERIAEAQEHNKKYSIVLAYKEKLAAKEQQVSKANEMNAKIESLTQERESLVNSAKLPIDGLTFGEDGLVLNGVPFVAGKVSDSQIMEVAAKLVIASNSNVNVFRIARGESLGSKRLKELVSLATANGFQGFIEEVTRGQNELLVEEYNEL